jgi:ribonuclease HI
MKESTYRVEKMEVYFREVCKLEERFDGIKLHHILQHDNEEVDALAKLASSQRSPLPVCSLMS